jgi:hypothetical protein
LKETVMKKFCVIGDKGAIASNHQRSWFESQEDAVAHAKGLLRNNYHSRKEPCKLLVVEINKVVEIESPPVTVRDQNDADSVGA